MTILSYLWSKKWYVLVILAFALFLYNPAYYGKAISFLNNRIAVFTGSTIDSTQQSREQILKAKKEIQKHISH